MIVHRLSPTPAEMGLHEILQILENCGDHVHADIVKELSTKQSLRTYLKILFKTFFDTW